MTTGLIRWTPQMDLLRTRVSRLFDDAFNEFVSPLADTEAFSTRAWMPPVDIRETDDELVLLVEVPGLTREDIQITLEDNLLTLSGERKFEKDVKKENYHRIERTYGKFSRSFSLPTNVRVGKVSASVNDGVLTVHLPKTEAAKPRKIEIK